MTKRMKNLPPALLATVLALFLSAVSGTAQGPDVPITYHGGSTLTSPINIYLIWYGQWPDKFLNNRQLLLERFIADSANSRYAHTNDAYFGNPSVPVYTLAGTAVDHYSQGFGTLTESTIYNIVLENAALNSWPLEAGWNSPSPLFFVISSADLRATLQLGGALAEFNVFHALGDPIQGMCGWHGSVLLFYRDGNPSFNQDTPNARFGFVGDPGDGGICMSQFNPPDPRFTSINSQVAPNNAQADAMIKHLAHEILEAANDPDNDAWHGFHGGESADACALNFGDQTQGFPTGGPNNGSYNLQINGNYYFVQQQWVNWGNGYCGMVYQPAEPKPVYPYDGLLHVGASFQHRWRSGLDVTPPDQAHPVTYSILYKYWPYNGTEPPGYSTLTDMQPCNMDSAGICNTTQTNLADGTYRWFVKANLNTGQSSPATTTSSIATFTVGYQPIATIPPPLPPGPFYPYDGLQGVGSNFPVQWHDGLDTERRNSGRWPVTYAIYYKYWPFGGVEPQNYTLVVANQPCNPVSLGICGTYVTGEPTGNFRWYVIANMDASLFTGVPNSILSTQSSVATFTVGP
jgi:hypothetical protein